MFDFMVPLTLYKPLFMLELIAATALTAFRLKKRPGFGWRALASVVLLLAAAVAFPVVWYNSIYVSCMFLVFFALLLGAMRFCYEESKINILFCGVIAYTTQHIAYETYNFLVTMLGLGRFGEMYQEAADAAPQSVFNLFLYIACYSLIYWMVWIITSYFMQAQENLDFGGRQSQLLLAFIIILVNVVLNAVLVYGMESSAELPIVVSVVMYLQSVLCCLLALVIQFTMLGKTTAMRETERIRELWRLDRELYERFQESAELINIKCHDLKHRLHTIQDMEGEISRQALGQVEQSIAIYDSQIQTGNQVLDTILSIKSLECEYEQIHFTCIAEGRELDFLSAENLYSLFGNAITNAIEAVKKTEEREKRLIHLDVVRRNDMIVIHVENYCPDAAELVFVNGLPETTKADRRNHGYGMRSMQLMAEGLGGGMESHLDNGMFHLNIFIPITASAVVI